MPPTRQAVRGAHRRLGSVDTSVAVESYSTFTTTPVSSSSSPPPPDYSISHHRSSFDRDACGPIRRVYYDDTNHWSVLTQLYGSVWPRVLPYCLTTMLLTLLVWYFSRIHLVVSITDDPVGHKFMATILSFLVVTRANIMYQRFMEARAYLNGCYKSCRELVQHACLLTQHHTDNHHPHHAVIWRHNVAYRTILLLRVTMAAVEYESQHKSAWEIPELLEHDKKDLVRDTIFMTTRKEDPRTTTATTTDTTTTPTSSSTSSSPSSVSTDLPPLPSSSPSSPHIDATTTRTLHEESLRAPLILAYNLRNEIMQQRSDRDGGYFRHVNEELKLLDCVGDFLTAFEGLQKLVTTPYPFPLVQMTRTFLFVFVFTLPFVLCHTPSRDNDNTTTAPLLEALSIMFLIAFGFLGLELVCMELNDPFGDDSNDLDCKGYAQLVYEDIYIAIYKADGEEAAHHLRRKIVKGIQDGPALENFQEEEEYRHPRRGH